MVTGNLLCAYVQFFLGKCITKTRKLKSKGAGQYGQGLLGFSPSLPLEASGATASLGTDDVSEQEGAGEALICSGSEVCRK